MEDSIFSAGEQSDNIILPPFTAKSRAISTVRGKLPINLQGSNNRSSTV